ncbi:DJ-1/PfpI family protein [Leptospira brenneri]|uniref:DJ-1/PfpI family protein n=1 Tax=Leptospira brenneri TaxID=2023182 RepID=A0A2M9XZ35_9LEPT|nr:DJ-1/PfpI family protein [Leptospira brenneri]PJZ44538.1 DJ-1/PfpI family protein [Leptospira brenneri]TGK95542.1 DJ-1/PfpI family protein [Leptospira brenneri]
MNQLSIRVSQQTQIHKSKFQTVVWIFVFIFGSSHSQVFANPKLSGNNHLAKLSIKPTHKKPVIVVIGENQYTELTDFIVPYGVLKRAEISEIYAIAPNRGKINMFPSLSIEIDTSINDFELLHPEGADLVIVPAIHNAENITIIKWIQKQYRTGATIVGICDGVWTLGHAGLLKNRKATGHWYSKENLKKSFSDTEWIQNERYIQDEKIITTTGVTASIPISLGLVESIAGKNKTERIAKDLGVADWSPKHNSSEFNFDWNQYLATAKNLVSFWNYETIGISIYDGMDEISLALIADSYSRTYKSKAIAITNHKDSILTKSKIRFLSEHKETNQNDLSMLIEVPSDTKAFEELEKTLTRIQERYGNDTMRFVANQLEFSIQEFFIMSPSKKDLRKN